MKDSRGKRGRERGPRINRQIRVPECRLVGEDGTQYGVVSLDEARNIAQDKGLDLVEVSPNAKPPVVKIIDYGKFKYDNQKKAAEAKKRQIVQQLKEIQFRPNIEANDLETKMKRARKFLEGGDKIKMVMQFRGREMAYKEAGREKFRGILLQVEKIGALRESEPKMMGNRIIVIMSPDKKLLQKYKDKKEGKA
ncbi:MAG: translation initiation factor IF-3 [Epsilonproteobacteria bacterium]|nr:MAG: translation initiation factor IF-3 [Campylobacterota bacterium]RLA67247.1 MAG: translation initiation factor IF-3 [Campylobacterota bacterium]